MEARIAEFLKNHKVLTKIETSRSYVFDCPACGGHNKLYIQKEDGRSVCFKKKTAKCPSAGSKVDYSLSLLSGLTTEEVKKELYGFVRQLEDEIRVSFDEEVVEKPKKELEKGSLPLDVLFIGDPEASDGLNYLLGRGLTLEVLKTQQVLYRPSRRMVIFPIIMDKILYGWQGRAIDPVPKEKRMDNMPGDWKASTIMFYENIVGKDYAIVAEGPVSAMKFAKAGNFVCTMGKEISKEQLRLLRQSGIKKLYLALDPDAFDKIHKIRDSMNESTGGQLKCYMIEVPPEKEDFGDCTYEECERAFREAKQLTGEEIFVYIEDAK